MSTVNNIYDAKTRLSQLVDQAVAGHDVVIGRHGKPLARITRLAGEKPAVRFGVMKGRMRIGADFDAPLTDAELAAFDGR